MSRTSTTRRRIAPRLAAALLTGILVATAAPTAAGIGSAPPAAATGLPAVMPAAYSVPTPVVIGRSVKGRAIYAYRIGNARSATKRVIIGQLHGNEKAGYQAARLLLTTVRRTDMDLWVVPTVNPDGYAANTRKNARGVDLNRNFPTAWAAIYPPSSGYYQGPAPRSEPETRAIYDFLWKIRPHEVVVLHQPLYGVDSYRVEDLAFHRRLVAATGLPSRSFSCSGVCRGTLQVWYNTNYTGSVITVEFGSAPSSTTIRRVALGAVSALRP